MRRTLFYFLLDLLWVLGAFVVYGLPLVSAIEIGQRVLQEFSGTGGWALALLSAYFGFLVTLIVVVGIFHRIFPAIPQGIFPIRSKEAFFFYLQHGLKCYITTTFLIRQINLLSILRTFYYRALGCDYSPSAFVGVGGELHDPSLIKVSERAFIGEGAQVYAHMVVGEKLHIHSVEIGPRALVGAYSIIGPGVTIGKRAHIAASSTVAGHTKIGPGELWLGTPAKRFKRLGRAKP